MGQIPGRLKVQVLGRAAVPTQTWVIHKTLWLCPELQQSATSTVPTVKKSGAPWCLCTHLFSVLLMQLGTTDVAWSREEFSLNHVNGSGPSPAAWSTHTILWCEENWMLESNGRVSDPWISFPWLYFPCSWGVRLSKLPFSSRLCHSFLYSYKAFWEELWGHCSWSGGACPRSCKILLSLHCLQKPPLRLPLAFEVWEPEGVCKGGQPEEQAAARLGVVWGDAADL